MPMVPRTPLTAYAVRFTDAPTPAYLAVEGFGRTTDPRRAQLWATRDGAVAWIELHPGSPAVVVPLPG
jgi:hypothetical protein